MVQGVGDGVVHVAVGDAVYGLVDFYHDGAAAEYVTIPARDLAKRPASVDDVHAAAMPLSALTAWQALVEQANLETGQRVLIHGGAGGVGAFAVQLAHALGADVYATASRRDLDFVRGLGADAVIDYRSQPFEDVAHDVDLVVDTVGGETLTRSLPGLRRGGTLVTLPAPPPRDLAKANGVRVVFFIVEPDRAELEVLAHLASDGSLRAEVARVYPLSCARAAYEFGLTGHPRGKVVVRVLG